jgi:glutathione S-transferase
MLPDSGLARAPTLDTDRRTVYPLGLGGPVKIYFDPITVNCRKVLAGCEFVGALFERVRLDYFAGDHKKLEFRAINPNERLPALVDDDLILWESNAILNYVADKTGGMDAYPADLQQRADIHRWQFWESSAWSPSCYTYLIENLVKPLTGAETDPAALGAEDPNFHKLAGILEQRLQNQPWLCGDTVTLADIAVAAPMHLHEHQKLPLESHPILKAWITRLEELACWKNTDPRSLLGLASL